MNLRTIRLNIKAFTKAKLDYFRFRLEGTVLKRYLPGCNCYLKQLKNSLEASIILNGPVYSSVKQHRYRNKTPKELLLIFLAQKNETDRLYIPIFW